MELIKDLGMLYPKEISKQKRRHGIFKCQCGNELKAQIAQIKNGNTQSCGCLQKQRTRESSVTHGLRGHRLYDVWSNIMQRTSNANNPIFEYYGGRGITVCERWKNIANFIEDMEPSYCDGLTIDRINNDGNYELSNCRWTTSAVQARNTRLIYSHNTSGYRGAWFNKRKNRWMAEIQVNRSKIYIGSFTTAIEAAKAYDKYVIDNNLEHTVNGV